MINYVLLKTKSREKADCTVLATMYSLALSYEEAHKLLEGYGRKARCRFLYRQAAWKLGFVDRPDLAACTLMTALKGMQSGRFVVKISGHVFAVVDGRIFDNHFTKTKCRVQMVYELHNVAKYPYLAKLAELDKLPDIRGINERRLTNATV